MISKLVSKYRIIVFVISGHEQLYMTFMFYLTHFNNISVKISPGPFHLGGGGGDYTPQSETGWHGPEFLPWIEFSISKINTTIERWLVAALVLQL
jgi:hypothetical protein